LAQQAWAQDQVPYLVKDLTPGVDLSLQSAANQFVVLGNRVLFANQQQAWATDGAAAGTVRMTNLTAPNAPAATQPTQIETVAGKVIFFAGDETAFESTFEPWVAGGSNTRQRAAAHRLRPVEVLRSSRVRGRRQPGVLPCRERCERGAVAERRDRCGHVAGARFATVL
jgi:hypothetical protein